MTKDLTELITVVTGHTAQLAEHDGSFKVIDTKLGHIKDLVEKMSAKLDRHCYEDSPR